MEGVLEGAMEGALQIQQINGDCVRTVDAWTRNSDTYKQTKTNWKAEMLLLLLFAFQSMFISIWVSRLEIAEFPDS